MNLRAVVFDWAGTAVDFGSQCPVSAFQAAFALRGVKVHAEDVHRFMGMRKREHIKAMLALPEIISMWIAANGGKPLTTDLDRLYVDAERLLVDTVAQFATPTPHLLDAVEMARSLGLRIGSCTGYTIPIMERLVPAARSRGFSPDAWVASDHVPQGRPAPWMIFRNMEELSVCPPCAVLKVGDTVADVGEGINAGAWTLGVVESSSMVGKSEKELKAMRPRLREALFRKVRKQYAEAGAHFVIRNLSELGDVLERIESRLDKGMMPPRNTRRSSRMAFAHLF